MALPPPWLAVMDALSSAAELPQLDRSTRQRLAQFVVSHVEEHGWEVIPSWAVDRGKLEGVVGLALDPLPIDDEPPTTYGRVAPGQPEEAAPRVTRADGSVVLTPADKAVTAMVWRDWMAIIAHYTRQPFLGLHRLPSEVQVSPGVSGRELVMLVECDFVHCLWSERATKDNPDGDLSGQWNELARYVARRLLRLRVLLEMDRVEYFSRDWLDAHGLAWYPR